MTETNAANLTPKQIRENEVNLYKLNIDTYKTLLETLDGNWDSDLVHLKDLDAHEAARQCPLDRLDRLAVVQQYDQITNLLKTEIVEYNKAKAILNIM